MHYYQFNIGDYRKDTQHLSPIEHYIYRQLIDSYYLDERPIPKETQPLLRRLSLGSEHEKDIQNILEDFFVFDADCGVWRHLRIDHDISEYRAMAEKNARNGKKGGRPKKEKPKKTQSVSSGNPSESQKKPNQETNKPINQETTNQEQDNHKPDSPKRITKPESFKAFFAAYPPNKKGGTDATAWKKAKSLNLGDDDFKAMLTNVQQRQVQCPSWYMQFAKGITRYMEERDWLTPVIPEAAPRETADQRRQRMIDERNQSLGITAAPNNGSLFEGEVISHE